MDNDNTLKNNNRKSLSIGKKILYGFIAFFILLFIIAVATDEQQDTNGQNDDTTEEVSSVVDYDVFERTDTSFSDTVRWSYKVVMPYPTSEDEIRAVAEEIVEDEKQTGDYNALSVLFYDAAEIARGGFSLARIEYAPDGEWAKAMDVSAGDYSTHEYVYDFRDKVNNPDEYADSRPTDEEFALCGSFDELAEADDYTEDEEVYIAQLANDIEASEDEIQDALFKCVMWTQY